MLILKNIFKAYFHIGPMFMLILFGLVFMLIQFTVFNIYEDNVVVWESDCYLSEKQIHKNSVNITCDDRQILLTDDVDIRKYYIKWLTGKEPVIHCVEEVGSLTKDVHKSCKIQ